MTKLLFFFPWNSYLTYYTLVLRWHKGLNKCIDKLTPNWQLFYLMTYNMKLDKFKYTFLNLWFDGTLIYEKHNFVVLIFKALWNFKYKMSRSKQSFEKKSACIKHFETYNAFYIYICFVFYSSVYGAYRFFARRTIDLNALLL